MPLTCRPQAVPFLALLTATLAVLCLLGASSARAAGVAQVPPESQAAASATDSLTGSADAASLTTQSVCSKPAPGQVGCLAQELVTKAGHHPVHPRLRAAGSPDRVLTRQSSPFSLVSPFALSAAPAAPAVAPTAAVPEPQAGTPAYMQQAYDLSYLSQTRGVGDTVAIVDAYDEPTAESDLATFRSTYGLPPCTTANGCFRKLNENGQASPLPTPDPNGWGVEEALDMEAVSSLCPNCHINLIEARSSYGSDLDTAEHTAAALGANQISNSWSGPGGGYSWSFRGIAIVASSGDSGYWGAGNAYYPAAMANVTAAGGTSLTGANASARGYTETAWGASTWKSGDWGAGSGCDLTQPKPSYQHDTGCKGRSVSDLSADADPSTGLDIYDGGSWFPVGGTSLASPLIAAYYALTGANQANPAPPAWAYANSSLLNDPSGLTVGSCATGIAYICTAGTGYDGPTGIGSISGAVVQGAPGIGGPQAATATGQPATYATSITGTSVKLTGGVYPNGLDTTYKWQYSTDTSYSSQTQAADIGSGTAPVNTTTTLTGIAPNTTYHCRLVAQNSQGTSYGYDFTFTTLLAPPSATTPPSITGTAKQGYTFTANPGSWSPAASSYTYQWQRNTGSGFKAIAGATAQTFTPGTPDLNASIDVVVTATNSGGSGSATSAAVGPVAANPPVMTAPPAMSGNPRQGQVLSATSTGTWSPAANSYSYQWQRSADGQTWSNITGATSSSYTLAATDVNMTVRLMITADGSYGTGSARTNTQGPILSGAPAIAAAPTLMTAGNPVRGTSVSVGTGSWYPSASSYAYQWQRSADGQTWANITGATSTSYTFQKADEADSIRAVVTATNTYGSGSAPTATTVGPVTASPPQNTTVPTVTGNAVRGLTLTGTAGAFSGSGNTYAEQWQRCDTTGQNCMPITGATALTYTVAVADEGSTLRLQVTATNPDASVARATAPTAVAVASPPVNTVLPSVTGNAQRASTLSATGGTWTSVGNTVAYQWLRCDATGQNCQTITGATGLTYTAAVADEGSTLVVTATATNPDGTVQKASKPTAVVTPQPPLNTAPPTLSGTAKRGSMLTATAGTWTGAGNSYAYQWQRCTSSGATCQSITGQTALTYTLTHDDEAQTVRLMMTATNPDGSLSKTTPLSAVVAAAPAVATHLPVISGPAQQGVTLKVSGQTWSATSDTTYSYAWERCSAVGSCVVIAGQTASSYTLSAADVGSFIVAASSASNADGTVWSSAAPTAAVLPATPTTLTAPTLSTDKTPKVGDVLTVTHGTFTGNPTSDVRQVYRCAATCAATAAAANAQSYTIAAADVGTVLWVKEVVSNPGGALTVWSATSVGPVKAAGSAAAALSAGQATLRDATGQTLAFAQLNADFRAQAAAVAARSRTAPTRTLTVRRAARVRGALRVWVSAPGARGAAPLVLGAKLTGRSVSVALPAAMTGKVVVVVQRAR